MPDTTQTRHLRYAVDNLSCGGCAARAEKAFSALPGVIEARVNFATRRADVFAEPGFDSASVAPAMAGAGYPATPLEVSKPIRLTVDNLSCGSCAARAQDALSAFPGIDAAQVNLATHRAEVIAAPRLDLARLQAHMDAVGFPVAPVETEGIAPAKSAEDEAVPYRRAFLWAAVLTLPVFVVEMGGHMIPALHHWLHAAIGEGPLQIMQFALTTAVLFGPGRVFLRLGLPALLRRAPEMNSLVVLGAGTAWAWSTLVTFAPDLAPEGGRHVYFEAAAVIITLILLGRWLEARARGAAGAAIAGLVALRPDTAPRLDDTGRAVEVPLDEIRVGDILRLRPGDRVAVDGEVVAGKSHLDEAMLSGEPVPVAKIPGDPVTGGTVNGTGKLDYRATAVGADTVLARIVGMVEDAQATRLPIQSLINRVTAVFVPIVVLIAVLAGAAWLIFGDAGQALVATVSVLIIACPCAMGLATPVSVLAGTGRAAELGVHFRRGDALQGLAQVDFVAFDKTGTLTEGRPSVTGLHPAGGTDADTLLALAAAAERPSEHPLARAIVEEAEARGLSITETEDFDSRTGAGVIARIERETLRVGSAAFLSAEGVAVPNSGAGAATRVHVARGALYLGHVDLSDPLKPDAGRAIDALRKLGLRVAILSGDAQGPVDAVADTLGVGEYRFGLSPEGKRAALDAWRVEGLKVAFVGDGINDAPILAAADVGIALGSGTDVAIEAAHVVLVSGAPSGVVTAHRVSRLTRRNIAQNLVWAFGYNVALIPVAAGLLAIFGGPLLSPMLAAGAMAASSVLVVLNALRLRRLEAA